MERLGIISLVAVGAVLLAVMTVLNPNVQVISGQQVKQFSSYQQLKDFINSSMSEYAGGYYGGIAAPAAALTATTGAIAEGAATSTKGDRKSVV